MASGIHKVLLQNMLMPRMMSTLKISLHWSAQLSRPSVRSRHCFYRLAVSIPKVTLTPMLRRFEPDAPGKKQSETNVPT